MHMTHLLADLAIDTPADRLPASAFAAGRTMTLDSLAAAVGGRDADGVAPMLEQLREWGGSGQATVLVSGDRLPAPHAAFANGLLIHALDYDDLYRPAALHLMSSVLPAALAGAELTGASGRDCLAGVILGVETAARLGLALRSLWRPTQAAGFLPSTIVGGFGATAAAARLLRLTVPQTVNALGLYYAQNAGNRQALYDKTLAKRIQPAFAARAALWAVQLARRGVTGPRHAIEGDAGLVRLYAGSDAAVDPDVLRLARPRWQIEELCIKRFPSCGACHPLTQAALDLVRDTPLRPDEIDTVELYLGEGGNRMVGLPFALGDTPQADAQFSAAYGVALALFRHEAGVGRYTDAAVRADRDVADLARRAVVLTHLADAPTRQRFDDDEPAWVDQPHVLTVKTHDGRLLSRSRTIRDVLSPGSATFETAAAKLAECAAHAGIRRPERVAAILRAVETLEAAPDVRALLDASIEQNPNP